MTPRFLEPIWHVRGSLPLAPGQTGEDAFTRLAPLFRQVGTSYERHHDTLTFRKSDPAAQDRMAVFENGMLRVDDTGDGTVLCYHLVSKALLFCFLAPLLFLAFAAVTVQVAHHEEEVAKTAPKKPEKKPVVLPQNAIDKALGAPAPEQPDKNKKDGEDKKKLKPTAAYVFAAIFAILYVAGRIIEQRSIRSTFRKHLFGT